MRAAVRVRDGPPEVARVGPHLQGGGARQRGLALRPLVDPDGQGPARPGRARL